MLGQSVVLPRGYVVVAKISRDGRLTGTASAEPQAKADKMFAEGGCTTFGTWEAFEADCVAQQGLDR
jgi:hypothetical protein